MTRETVYAALYALSAATLGLETHRRRLRHWSDLSMSEFPALFQGQGEEEAKQQRGRPTIWLLKPKQYLYVHAGDDTTVDPSTLINPLLDLLMAEFMPPSVADQFPGANTLGGLASHAWITRVEMMEGVLGAVEVAIVNFEILTV